MAYFVNPEKCVACWGCIASCPTVAIVQNSNSAVVIPEICIDCGVCARVCPVSAINLADSSVKLPSYGIGKEMEPAQIEFLEYDIVVIGGGPGGLTVAYYAGKAGFKVALIERRNEWGKPVACAEGISVEGLTRAFEVRDEWVSSPIEGAKLIAPGGREVFVDHPDAGFVLDRPRFEADLARMCRQVGVDIFQPAVVREVVGEEFVDFVLVETGEGLLKLSGKFFVGADGVAGLSTRWCCPEEVVAIDGLHSCAQVLVESPEISGEAITEFWWGRSVAPGGYAWVFPKGNNRANVGLGIVPAMTETPAEKYLECFLSERFGNYRVIERRDGVIHTTGRISTMGRGNLLLVGDAARLANPISGGGLDCALASGKIVAELLTDMWNAECPSILQEYERKWLETMGRYLDIYAKIRRGVMRLADEDMDKIAEVVDRMLGGKRWNALDIPAIVKNIVLSSPKLLALAGKIIFNI